jgi:hypothetical protein
VKLRAFLEFRFQSRAFRPSAVYLCQEMVR